MISKQKGISSFFMGFSFLFVFGFFWFLYGSGQVAGRIRGEETARALSQPPWTRVVGGGHILHLVLVVVKILPVRGYAPAGRFMLIGGAPIPQRLLGLFYLPFVGFAQDARRFTYLLGARVLARIPVPRLTVNHLHALSGFNVGSETRDQVGGRQWLEEDERNVVETIRLIEIFLEDQVNVANRRFFRLKHGPKHGLNVGLIMIRRNTRKKYGRNLSQMGCHDWCVGWGNRWTIDDE